MLVKRTPVWVQIELKAHNAESFARFEALVHDTPEVTECVAVGGGVDYLVKFEATTIDTYQRLIDEWLVSDVGIERYFTYIVTKTVKRPSASISIDDLAT
ncbi:leucine-responsive regulatory protein [Halomonas elongata]|uniref:Leucine-responsive regulatory protein n=1 Tax=Halomonas elongata TaxID=2746 RepID=A0A1B8NWI6_HALEL|nr:leucine-responsive regulatory protein [Halomonas elongata]